jgi:ubiquinone/menaquinone biosynthesis C-methylase UbiE
MKRENTPNICPVERAGGLDNWVRRILQNPHKLLSPYLTEGMTVLDVGCGPGFFSVEMARLLKDSGKVIAADLQDGMLEKIRNKIKGTVLEQRIELHLCEANKIGVNEKVDFILCFYMIHEVPDQDNLFNELISILKPKGKIFIIEPTFHVSEKSFGEMISRLNNIGLEIIDTPNVFFSRTVLLTRKT